MTYRVEVSRRAQKAIAGLPPQWDEIETVLLDMDGTLLDPVERVRPRTAA